MSFTEKARKQAEEMKGKTKEWVGEKTSNEKLQAEGANEQAKAREMQAGEQARKDAGT